MTLDVCVCVSRTVSWGLKSKVDIQSFYTVEDGSWFWSRWGDGLTAIDTPSLDWTYMRMLTSRNTHSESKRHICEALASAFFLCFVYFYTCGHVCSIDHHQWTRRQHAKNFKMKMKEEATAHNVWSRQLVSGAMWRHKNKVVLTTRRVLYHIKAL